MKVCKKIVASLLVLMLTLCLSITAFAAEASTVTTGTIVADNPVAGQTYTAYKIFDVSYNDDKTA